MWNGDVLAFVHLEERLWSSSEILSEPLKEIIAPFLGGVEGEDIYALCRKCTLTE